MSMDEIQDGVQGDSDLAPARAHRLLTLGLTVSSRPVDIVLDRLNEPDAASWLNATLDAAETALDQPLRPALRAGDGGVEALIAIKDGAKASLSGETKDGDPAAGVLLYFLAVAAAQAHHGVLISSQPKNEVAETLGELAAALPEAWSRVCDQAAAQLRG